MSTVTATRAALVTLWAALFDATTTQVGYGTRVTISLGERVSVGDVDGRTTPGPNLGPSRQTSEDYVITCMVSVTRNGTPDQQQAVSERAVAIWEACELAVRSLPNENLNVSSTLTPVVLALVEGTFSVTEAPAQETAGRLNTTVSFGVRVQARYRLP